MSKTVITLEQLREGSDEVLARVYEENRNTFIAFAARYGLPREEVVDAYQDAFVAFHHNITSGRIESFTSSVTTYLISIGKYQLLNKIKSRKKTIQPDFDISVLQQDKEELQIDALDIDPDNPTEEQRLFNIHFKQLGKKCKELLDLFYYRGYTISDILELGIYNSENVIKSTKSRCIKTLKERILNPNQYGK